MTRPSVDYWYEFASTYSYPATMRIGALAESAGVDLVWRPFLLGVVFRQNELPLDSPFNWQPVKGRYMWRDMARICATDGLPFKRPNPFPQASLSAARIATAGLEAGWTPEFSRRLYLAEFGEGKPIDDTAVLTEILDGLGLNGNEILELAAGDSVKARLRQTTETAITKGVFGAPSLTTADGELFWGNDRLEAAMEWALGALGKTPRPGA